MPSLDERHRLETLRLYGVLDTPSERALDDLTALAAAICGTPIAMISLVDEHRQWFKSKIGLEAAETPREFSFCAHALGSPDLFIVPDASRDERFAGNPLVTGEPHIRFYAGARLATKEGAALGTLCVIDRVSRTLTPLQEQTLRVLAQQVMAQLDLRRQTRDLAESEERSRAIVESALDAIVTIDHENRITEFNPAAEKIFGWSRAAVMGREMADIIIPERFREAHRRGMARYLETGVAVVLDRRIELTALRSDGTEFPVELTATRLGRSSPSRFTAFLRDITERKQAEERVVWLASFPERNPNPILEIDFADGMLHYANPSALRLFPDLQNEGFHHPLVAGLREMEVPFAEQGIMRRDLAVGEFYFSQVVTYLATSRRLRVYSTDITDRKKAEAALRENEQKLRQVIDGLGPNTFLGLMTPDGTLIEANRPGLAAAGIRSEDALGRPFDQTFWWGHSEQVRGQLRDAMARGAKGEASCYDVQVRVAGDALVWIDFSLTPVKDAAGRVIYLVPSGNVIEERVSAVAALRESEEHFRFLNDLGEATRTLDDPARIMAVMARMLGGHLRASRCAYADVEPDGEQFSILHDYTDGCASTVGRYRLSLFGPLAVATLHRGQTLIIGDVEAELPPGEGSDMFNAIGIRAIICCPLVKEGGLRAMMAVHQTTPRDWKPGEIAMVQDVVERCWATIGRRAAEEKIRHLNAELEDRVLERTAQLEAANKELEAFSYSVSHDLRAPLRGVDGYVRMLQEDYGDRLDAEGNRLIGVVSSEAKRMGRLIDDLLAFSRMGRQQMGTGPVDMASLARTVFESLTVALPGAVPRFELKPLPPAHGDLAMLRQVFANLIGNAVKFSRHQPVPVVEVGGAVGDAETSYYVKDNGAGFDEQYRDKLFGVFQRLHSEEEFEGTGVGLALVQRVVHRHGGKVWAEGKPGHGATFHFTLPHRKESNP